ncbi:MAG: SPASM domain-containing protein [Proteobacteria bacterium]|nr:SPASM domain-containing protein [Pseudomonadota bacterium]
MTKKEYRLQSVFLELTRSCDHKCLHCRVEAGDPLSDEIGFDAMMDIAGQLVELKVHRVILTGGEPLGFAGWDRIALCLSKGGTKVRLFTNGSALDKITLKKALNAGVSEFAVSLDGPRAIHDRLRPKADITGESSFDTTVAAVEMLVKEATDARVVTQVNRLNISSLNETYRIVKQLGAKYWQVHLCQMTGRAKTNRGELMLDSDDLETVVSTLLTAAKERKVLAPLHCTVGYMTEEEPVLRGREKKSRPVWLGCEAGKQTLAISSNGNVKGCTTLPDEFATGSLKKRSVADIWADDVCFPYTRSWTPSLLAGMCAECPFAKTCRAGCPAVAYGATGTIGANPYCLRLVRRR